MSNKHVLMPTGLTPRSRVYCKRAWSLAERIAYYSRPDPLSGCHIWHGSLRDGYGYLRYKRRPRVAHRLAWEAKHGPIPKGMVLRHRCNVRSCVNPDHLVPGTPAENSVDIKVAHRRLADARTATAKALPGANAKARPIRIFYDGIELAGDVTLRILDADPLGRP